MNPILGLPLPHHGMSFKHHLGYLRVSASITYTVGCTKSKKNPKAGAERGVKQSLKSQECLGAVLGCWGRSSTSSSCFAVRNKCRGTETAASRSQVRQCPATAGISGTWRSPCS